MARNFRYVIFLTSMIWIAGAVNAKQTAPSKASGHENHSPAGTGRTAANNANDGQHLAGQTPPDTLAEKLRDSLKTDSARKAKRHVSRFDKLQDSIGLVARSLSGERHFQHFEFIVLGGMLLLVLIGMAVLLGRSSPQAAKGGRTARPETQVPQQATGWIVPEMPAVQQGAVPAHTGPAPAAPKQVKEAGPAWPEVRGLPSSHGIKAEIMLSAGPRKDAGSKDTELGEDVAGVLSLPDQAFFWLLDGTSDSVVIKSAGAAGGESYLFSSRMLAQHIGYYIQKHIAACVTQKTPLHELLTRAREYVAAEWTARINDNGEAGRKDYILKLLKDGYQLLCSATIVMGRFGNDGWLRVLRAGDSKVFPFVSDPRNDKGLRLMEEFKMAAPPMEENDRIAFRLDYNEPGGRFIIRTNNPSWAEETAGEVETVFIFSDGIGKVVETQLASRNPGIAEVIRENISRIQQKTFDDKSLIILERFNPG